MKFGFFVTTLALLIAGPAMAGPAITDTDSDGTFDVLDICSADPTVPVPNGGDADNDGYGDGCDADFNNDGVVNSVDSGIFLVDLNSGIPTPGLGTDTNGDGVVNAIDTGMVIPGLSLGVPGPSGLSCAGTVPCP